MPKLISIAGSSGVGKTTISRIIQHVLGEENTICISGDDLHKWERNNSIWDTEKYETYIGNYENFDEVFFNSVESTLKAK
jgi:uridine kinase